MAARRGPSTKTTLHTLLGAPDGDGRETTSNNGRVQIMRIDLPRETVVEMQRCSKAGKPLQLSFGKNPALRFGNTSHPLHVAPSTFRDEVYKVDGKDDTAAQFVGLVTHSMGLEKAYEATAGADEALNKLKASMASWESEKKNNQTTLVDAKVKAGSRPSIGSANNKRASALLKRPHLNDSVTKSLPSSPSTIPSMPIPPRPPSSLVDVSDMAKSVAKPAHRLTEGVVDQQKLLRLKRRAMVHLLAVQPISEEDIMRLTGIPTDECHSLLEKAGKKVDELWGLSDKYYKELDVHEFGYSDEQLEKAVENAIRAYDRQRLQPDDELWQRLLPHGKRDKGICLSKLNLGQSFMNSNHRSLLANAGEGVSSLPRSRSQEPAARKKPSQKEQQTRRLLSTKPGKPAAPAKSTPKTDDEGHKPSKESKVGEKRKQPAANPKIKSAEFVHDSDEEALSDLDNTDGSIDRQGDAKRLKDNDSAIAGRATNVKAHGKAQPSKSKPEGTTKPLPNGAPKVSSEKKLASSTETKGLVRCKPDSSKSSKSAADNSKSTSHPSPVLQKPKTYTNGYSSLTPAKRSNVHHPTSSTSSIASPNTPRPSTRPAMEYPTASSSNDETTPNAKRQKSATKQSVVPEGTGTTTPPLSQPSSSSSPPSNASKSNTTNATNTINGSKIRTDPSPSPNSLEILRAESAAAWTKYYAIQYSVATASPGPLPAAQRNNLLAAYATAEALCVAVKARTLELAVDSGAHDSTYEAERAELATRKRPEFWQGREDWQRWLPAPGAELPEGLPEVMRPEVERFRAKFDAMMEKAEKVERPSGTNDDSLFGRGYDPRGANSKSGDKGAPKPVLGSADGSPTELTPKRKWDDLTEAEQKEDAANRETLWNLDEKMAQGQALIAEAEYQQTERHRKIGKV